MSETQPLPNEAEARTPTGEIKDQTPTQPETTVQETKVPDSKPEEKSTTPPPSEEKPSLLNEKGAKADGAPDKYDFKLPEGFEMPEETSKEVNTMFKELNLTNDAGQKLLDYYAKKSQEASEAPFKLWQDTQEKWIKEVKNDPEIGSKMDEVKTTVSKAIDGLGDAKLATAFREAMDYTGAGNNPAFIKAFYKLAQKLTEGGHVSGNAPSKFGQVAPGTSEKPTAAKAIYPNLP